MFHKMLQQLSCDPFNATKEKWFPWFTQHNSELLGWYERVMVFDICTAIWRAFCLSLYTLQCCKVLHIKRATRTTAVWTFSVRSFYCGNSHIKQLIFFYPRSAHRMELKCKDCRSSCAKNEWEKKKSKRNQLVLMAHEWLAHRLKCICGWSGSHGNSSRLKRWESNDQSIQMIMTAIANTYGTRGNDKWLQNIYLKTKTKTENARSMCVCGARVI